MDKLTQEQKDKLMMIGLISVSTVGASYYIQKSDDNVFKDIYNYLDRDDLDSWTLAHFIMHMSIGFTVPDKYYLSTLLGFTWEQIEQKLGENDPLWIDNSEYDYFINHLGLFTGVFFNRYLK